MKRPLLYVALFYGCGIVPANFVPLPVPLLFALSFGLLLAALLWKQARLFFIVPLLVLIGWTNLTLQTAIISPHDTRNLIGNRTELVTVRGTLRETPGNRVYEHNDKESWRTMAKIDLTGLRFNKQTNWLPAFGGVAVSTPGILPTNFFAGQNVEITGVIHTPKPAIAEGTFDYQMFLNRLGIYYQLQAASADDWQIISSPSTPPLADRFCAWARNALALGLPAEDESLRLEWALTLGWRAAMTGQVSEPFIRAATYHIFAVDGLRMAIIFGIFFALFRALNLPRAVCGLLLIPLIWFYAALTGWPASAIRATVMLTIIIIGWALKRPSDLINSLFAAALIILVWQPQQLFQAGFQLSFFVVLCIILIFPTLDRFGRLLFKSDPLFPDGLRPRWQKVLLAPIRFVLDILLVSLAAWLGSIPLVAYYFHIVTPVSAPANLLAVPLCALVLAGNLTSLLLAGWFPAAAQLFNHAGWFVMECIRVSSHWFADWPGAYRYVPAPGFFTTGLYYSILLGVFTGWIFKSRFRAWKIGGLILLSLVWCAQWQHERSAVRLSILPLNGGHAIYFDAPGGQNDLLIDCGSESAAEFVVKPFLRAQGVNHLNRLALTHGDLRHVGGAQCIEKNFSVKQVVTSPVRFRSPAYRNILRNLEQTPERWRKVDRGENLGAWKILHPGPADHFPQADDDTLVLFGNIEGTRVLLLSDLGRPGQSVLLERTPDLHADIVITGLPRESEPLSDSLLDAIQPRLIIVADSELPATGRASPKLRERIAQRKIPVLYTRDVGGVKLTFRSAKWGLTASNGTRLTDKLLTAK